MSSGINTILQNSMEPVSKAGLFEEKDGTELFSALTQQQSGMETLSNQFLQTGIDEYLNKDYESAAKSFQAAVSLAPHSAYNVESSQYLVKSYLQLEETDKAIEAYQAAIQRNPDNDSLRSSLGQLYFSEDRYEEAAEEYRGAVQVNPIATNRYSYGEALLKIGNYSEAEYQFNQVKRLDSDSYAGDYGLGKMYAQEEQYDEAIEHFEKALALQPDFYDALAEIGYTYADMGEIEKAREVEEDLEKVDEDLALILKNYVDEKEPPKIAFAYASSTFPYNAPKGYPVSAIDPYLESAGAELNVTMKFLFTKEMDPASVEDQFNWTISRASSSNIAETYNFGDEIPSTEITLDPYPNYVIYDRDTLTATVGFSLRQNETADGTIDPSHIIFQFDGEDIYGVAMDQDGDEFSGFSRSA
jgi:tetratricopeptide (TPR) repeat protein